MVEKEGLFIITNNLVYIVISIFLSALLFYDQLFPCGKYWNKNVNIHIIIAINIAVLKMWARVS